jgi:hypothetical protein
MVGSGIGGSDLIVVGDVGGRAMAHVRGAAYPPPIKGMPSVPVILHENEVVGARTVPLGQSGDVVLARMMQEFAEMVGHKGPAPETSNSDAARS